MNPPTARERSLAIATLVLTLLGWSSIPLFLRYFSKDIDFWTANGWRYVFAAALWAPVLVWGWWRSSLPAGLWRAAFWPGMFNFGGQVLFGLAPYLVSPGLMTFSLRVQIIFVSVGAAVLFPSERTLLRRPGFVLGIIMVMLGTAGTILFREGEDLTAGKSPGWGIAVSIGAGLLYAAYSLLVRRQLQTYPALTSFAAVSQISALPMVVLMLCFARHAGVLDHGMHALELPPTKFLLLVLSAVIGIGLGHTLYFYSLQKLGIAASSGVVQLQPVAVSIASMRMFGERLTLGQWICGGVAVAGALTMLVVQHREARRAG